MIRTPPNQIQVYFERSQQSFLTIVGFDDEKLKSELILVHFAFHTMADSPLVKQRDTLTFMLASTLLKEVLY